MRTDLAKISNLEKPTSVAIYNTAENIIVKGKSKQKISRAIYMRFYWVCDRIRQNHFHVSWEEVKKNLADYFTKHKPIWKKRNMRPIFWNQQEKK